MAKRVLFLCTGNYYRSRYAEELFNYFACQRGLEWRAFSRGAAERGSPDNVGPISRFAREELEAKGIVSEGMKCSPRPCSLADFDDAALVIALKETEHRPLIERRFPEAAGRVVYWHVDDVDLAHPSVALALIEAQIEELIMKIN